MEGLRSGHRFASAWPMAVVACVLAAALGGCKSSSTPPTDPPAGGSATATAAPPTTAATPTATVAAPPPKTYPKPTGTPVADASANGRYTLENLGLMTGRVSASFGQYIPVQVSEDGMHFAYVSMPVPGEQYAVLDGRRGPKFVEVPYVRISPDGQHVASVGTVKDEDEWVYRVLVDGKDQTPSGYVILDEHPYLTFSPDSQRLAYHTRVGKVAERRPKAVQTDRRDPTHYDRRYQVVVIDGKLMKERPYVPRPDDMDIGYSPDGRHAIWIDPVKSPNGVALMVDGKPGPVVGEIEPPVTFGEGGRIAYVASRPGRTLEDEALVIVDGKAGPVFSTCSRPVFSADGRHVAYVATRATGEAQVVLDGTPGPTFALCGEPVFSPDGKRLVYTAKQGGSRVLVIDGKAGPAFDAICGQPYFSPDSRHVSYIGFRGKTKPSSPRRFETWPPDDGGGADPSRDCKFVGMIDDRAAWECDDYYPVPSRFPGHGGVVEERSPGFPKVPVFFSPDGKRSAYASMRGEGQCMVIDGREEPMYRTVSQLAFSPDGRRVAYTIDSNGGCGIVVDGKLSDLPPGIYFSEIYEPVFSPNSKHLVFAAQGHPVGEPAFVVYDGKADPIFTELLLPPSAPSRTPLFQPDGTLEYLANKMGSVHRVTHRP